MLRQWLLERSNLIPRGSRAMLMAHDQEVAKRNKNIKLRSLRYSAKQIMAKMQDKAQCSPLYKSVGVKESDDGVPIIVSAMKNVLQYDFNNSI